MSQRDVFGKRAAPSGPFLIPNFLSSHQGPVQPVCSLYSLQVFNYQQRFYVKCYLHLKVVCGVREVDFPSFSFCRLNGSVFILGYKMHFVLTLKSKSGFYFDEGRIGGNIAVLEDWATCTEEGKVQMAEICIVPLFPLVLGGDGGGVFYPRPRA